MFTLGLLAFDYQKVIMTEPQIPNFKINIKSETKKHNIPNIEITIANKNKNNYFKLRKLSRSRSILY